MQFNPLTVSKLLLTLTQLM